MELNPKEFPTLSTWEPNFQRNSGESNQTSKPKQNGNHFGGQAVDGNHTGNGLEDTIWKHLVGKPERGPVDGTQPQNAAKMREQNIPWAESYPGEMYPIE